MTTTSTVLDAPRRPSMARPSIDAAEDTIERFPSLDLTSSHESARGFEESYKTNNSPWLPRQRQDFRDSRFSQSVHKHRSRKSVGEAIGNFRARRGSVIANAEELAESLKAPISWKLIAICITWYMSSALTNTSAKSILNTFPKPVTLTLIQFGCVPLWCLLCAWLAHTFPSIKTSVPALKNGLRRPSPEVIIHALPLSVFQLLGHILSATATSKIPVSLVHTIKGLSPLFTVLAYRLFFRIRYARATYLSLIPLTTGVMLACSADFSTNMMGISCAFIATVVFVGQNIFSKKLFNDAARAEAGGDKRKLDKLNLLCYCSAGAFVLTAPVWLFTEGFTIIGDLLHDGAVDLTEKKNSLDHGELAVEFFFNGVFHFGQNILAFVILSMLSPVSYSVASLIKRVWIVVIAVIWFRSSTTLAQGAGIFLTFLGLYLYDRNMQDDAAERRAKADHFRHQHTLLPLSEESNGNGHATLPNGGPGAPRPELKFEFPPRDNKRDEDPAGQSSQRTASQPLLPGAKQESTWQPGDAVTKS